ncbi:MAG TPA: hypothetical protein VF105_02600 [Gemmatimonadaceae bacterium]
MSAASASSDHTIRTITMDGRKYNVILRIGYDGVEYVGRLRFTDTATPDLSFQDHGSIPGASMLEAVRKAKEFTVKEIEQRLHRALSEKRRFNKLRDATDDMINTIKYLNRLAIDIKKGRLDNDGGKQELEQVQNQLLEIVKTFRHYAGVEDHPQAKRTPRSSKRKSAT